MKRQPLSKETVQAWRRFSSTPEFRIGMDFVRLGAPPINSSGTVPEMLESAIKWNGYMAALHDIEFMLTEIKQSEASLDEPPLEAPDLRR